MRRAGDDALLLRRWDEATDLFSKSIAIEKENWLGYQKRAAAYAGAGLVNKAIEDLDVVIRMKPDHVKSVTKRAELFLSTGRFQVLIARLRSALF